MYNSSVFKDEDRARLDRAKERGKRMTVDILPIDEDAAATAETTPASRIDLLVELIGAAWSLTGEEWPRVPRSQWPVRRRRLGDAA